MKNYKFSSLGDVFETRNDSEIKKSVNILNNKDPNAQPAAYALNKVQTFKPRTNIPGYQKKIFVSTKRFHEDLLMETFLESDEG